MARMMDSLILENFSPYTFTKITTTHRQPHMRQGTSKKGNTSSSANPNQPPPSAITSRNSSNMQRNKIPMQGEF